MGRKPGGNRVLGPYWHPKERRWRYCAVIGGQRTWFRCRPGCSEKSAQDTIEACREGIEVDDELTVAEAIDVYLDAVERRTESRSTVTCENAALKPLMEARGDFLISSLAPRHIDKYLADIETGRSMATQKSYWLTLRRAAKWWALHGYTTTDVTATCLRNRERRDNHLPWKTRIGAKKLGRGKPQLRNLKEVRKYVKTAMAFGTPERRVATVLPVLTGLSSGEIRHLRVADVDLDAGVIRNREDEDGSWDVKTASRVRSVEIPDVLSRDLGLLVKDGEPRQLLFCQAGENRQDRPRNRTWLRGLVIQVCEDAEVRVVPPHGLRATYSSMLMEIAGQTASQIGQALGHGDKGVTAKRHYIGAEKSRPALKLVVSGGEK